MGYLLEKLGLSFHELEEILWQELRKLFCKVLQEMLEGMDKQIFKTRDKVRYRVYEIRSREVETLVGPIKFKRRCYVDRETNERVFLLDEILGLPGRVRISPGLAATVAELGVTGPSYRQARDGVCRVFGERIISHEGIRQVVNQVGKKLDDKEKGMREDPQGSRKVPVLFLEVDGLVVSLQQEKKRSKEIQVLVSHEGWQKKSPGSRQYELVNRHHFSWDKAGFWEEAGLFLEAHYDLEETVVVINGDRAFWVRRGVEYFPKAVYQIDRFHLKRDLKVLLNKQPDRLKAAFTALGENDTGSFFAVLAEAVAAERNREQKLRLKAFLDDLLTVQESIKDYRARLKEKGIETEGFRGLGAAESQINRYGNRLKKRGQSWRQYGLRAMLACLNARFERRLAQAAEALDIPEEFFSRKQLHAEASGVAIRLIDQGWVKKGHFPARERGRQASGGLSVWARQLVHPGTSAL